MNHLAHLLGCAPTLKTTPLDHKNSDFLISKYFLYLYISWQNLETSKNEKMLNNFKQLSPKDCLIALSFSLCNSFNYFPD